MIPLGHLGLPPPRVLHHSHGLPHLKCVWIIRIFQFFDFFPFTFHFNSGPRILWLRLVVVKPGFTCLTKDNFCLSFNGLSFL